MKGIIIFLFAITITTGAIAQKKPLDHTVYDGWQSIGERMISNDGKWIVYTITPQEGDNELVIQSADAKFTKSVARGYGALITEDSRYVVFKIKPLFKDTRDARIKKKKPEEMPKDSIAIVALGADSVWKLARIKTFKTPEKESGWVAYHLEKPIDKKDARKPEAGDKKVTDSLNRVIDSLHQVIASMPKKKKNKDDDMSDAEGDETPAAPVDAGTDLVVRNLQGGRNKTFANVLEYYFSKKGGMLVFEQAKNPKDSMSKNSVVLYDLEKDKTVTLSRGGNDFKNFAFSEDGSQVAYVAERDAKPKELQKFYKLWYYKTGMDSATLLADKNSVGMKLGMTVSEFGTINFSKTGRRLFFGTAPIQPPKDTTLVEIDLVKVDVWHYNDDYLQTQQLFRLQRDLQTNYLAVYDVETKSIKQLGSVEMPLIYATNEGDGDRFVGVTDFGKRVESQWAGNTKKDIYAIDMVSGEKKLVKKDMLGFITPQFVSPSGNIIMWYESKARNYFAWDGDSIRNISKKIKVPLWDEENDSPADPSPYGLMGWHENDSAVYVYDKFDAWKIGMDKKAIPVVITGNAAQNGRKTKNIHRYLRVDPDERFVKSGQTLYFRVMNDNSKYGSIVAINPSSPGKRVIAESAAVQYNTFVKAKNADSYVFSKENYVTSPDLYSVGETAKADVTGAVKLSTLNPQQKDYVWGTSELYKWKAFDGKMSEGVLYKPDNFDPNKKYPLILYFYETHSNTVYDYIDPTPTGSRLNISFFVSRGYLVFSPDIHYTIGHPAKSAYNYVVSAAKDLAKHKWVDAANIGIQGQSWGGIQVAQLVTMTDMFKAAWAGAPVANMTSAYGGIRWESGVNRQFQYEKTQSRIGATLWEKPQLYIENSPLFHLPKVKTPLVIMANDADGAVPWYQGIELFTGMRRLGKKVWMLNYNGEAHNLVERKNKKDIQIREQQYFDWLLKGEHPPAWITEGVPAVKKGKDWGLELTY